MTESDDNAAPEVADAPVVLLPSYSGHPPRSHNPHVYQLLDAAPESNPVSSLVVHSHVAPVEDTREVELVDLPDGSVVTPGAEPVGDAEPADAVDYEAFTKDDLVAECKDRELPSTGNKPELADRLRADDAAKAESGA